MKTYPNELYEWIVTEFDSEKGLINYLKEGAPDEIKELYEDYINPSKKALEEAKKKDPHVMAVHID